MAGWHHQCNGLDELGQTLEDGEGQEGLACCSPWGHKGSDMTVQLNINSVYKLGFPGGSVVKNLPDSAGDKGLTLIKEDLTCVRATKPVRHNY